LSQEEKNVVQRVLQNATAALKPLKKHTFFGSVGLITSYDTNVFSDANNVALSGGSKKASLKETLQASIGYASPLASEWQTVFNYRGNGNKNFNAESADGQFVQNELNFYLNNTPLEETAFGIKLGGQHLFQYASASSKFEPYQLQLSAGPYLRLQLAKTLALNVQGNFYYRNVAVDSALDAQFHRSGTEEEIKVMLQRDTHHIYFNPSFEITASLRGTKGTEFQSKFFQGELSNTAYFTNAIQGVLGVSYAKSMFDARPDGSRSDGTLNFRLGISIRLLKSLYWINDAQLSSNASNVDTYAYSRNLFSSGINFSF